MLLAVVLVGPGAAGKADAAAWLVLFTTELGVCGTVEHGPADRGGAAPAAPPELRLASRLAWRWASSLRRRYLIARSRARTERWSKVSLSKVVLPQSACGVAPR